jgi:hypothetical protein
MVLFCLALFFFIISEADEILKICNVIGSPGEQSWPEGLSLAETMKYKFPQVNIRELLLCLVMHRVKNMFCPWIFSQLIWN